LKKLFFCFFYINITLLYIIARCWCYYNWLKLCISAVSISTAFLCRRDTSGRRGQGSHLSLSYPPCTVSAPALQAAMGGRLPLVRPATAPSRVVVPPNSDSIIDRDPTLPPGRLLAAAAAVAFVALDRGQVHAVSQQMSTNFLKKVIIIKNL
jgi:hypothetical protein